MIEGKNIVYFANDYSADNKTSSHQNFKILSRYNRMLYVEAGGLRAPKSNIHDFKRILEKVSGWFKGPRRISENVFVFTLLLVPLHRFAVIRKFNEWFISFSVRRVMKGLGMIHPIVWMTIPHMEPVVGRLGEEVVVYYCVDDYSEMPNVDKAAIKKIEGRLLRKSDVVFTTSRALCEERVLVNPNTHHSPHAVDFAHFHKATFPETLIPEDVASLKHPVVGFFGLIEDWMELDALEYAVQTLPDFEFVMIGRVVVDVSRFDKYLNIRFIGKRPFGDLPGYLKHFDVCISPKKRNNYTKYVNPIKIKEYLAGGKPVVSTWTKEMEYYEGYVHLAKTREEFADFIRKAVKEDGPLERKNREDYVREDTWDRRVEEISRVVIRTIEGKEAR